MILENRFSASFRRLSTRNKVKNIKLFGAGKIFCYSIEKLTVYIAKCPARGYHYSSIKSSSIGKQ